MRNKRLWVVLGIVFLVFIFAFHIFISLYKKRVLSQIQHRVTQLEHSVQEKLQQPAEKVVETVVSKCQPWGVLQQHVHDCVGRVSVYYAEFDWLQPFKTPRQKEGSGSGFFINDEGDFITNAHVVDQAYAIGIQIPSCGLEIFDAEVRGISFD